VSGIFNPTLAEAAVTVRRAEEDTTAALLRYAHLRCWAALAVNAVTEHATGNPFIVHRVLDSAEHREGSTAADAASTHGLVPTAGGATCRVTPLAACLKPTRSIDSAVMFRWVGALSPSPNAKKRRRYCTSGADLSALWSPILRGIASGGCADVGVLLLLRCWSTTTTPFK
jgi:hypothetical protein